MMRSHDSLIVQGVTRFIIPIIQIFGLYVIFHGHYSPGGGFQGGALLATSIILERIVLGRKEAAKLFTFRIAIPLGVIGLFIYAGVGLFALMSGKYFLDYAALPLPLEPVALRSMGILLVEVGVGLAVLGTLVGLYDQIADGGLS